MDIRKWLQDTADRAPPDQSDQVNIPAFLRSQDEELDRGGRNNRRKKTKRASSDSSVIAPKHSHHHTEASARRQSKKHVKDRAGNSTSSRRSASSRSSRKTPSDKPVKTYERRPRHKTKPDRYERKTKKPKKERDPRKEKKSTQRRSHRSTTGLVQSFQLKNGPKNGRLTLKPDTHAGLFKHGRASVQMSGRGNGLPDLVFNEMKFLQRPTEHQDEPAEAEVPRHASKDDRKRTHDEEISAYFITNKVADAEHSEVANKRQKKTEVNERGQSYRQRDETGRKTSPVELPEKPFLGFGSEDAQPESKRTHHESSGYYSWSESAPGHSLPARKPSGAPPKQQATHQMSQRRRQDADGLSNAHDCQEDHGKDRDSDVGEWIQTRRTRGPALVEIYQPPAAHKRRERKNDTSVTRTTMQSLPRHHSPKDRGHRDGADESVRSERLRSSYRTSDILNIHELRQSLVEQMIAKHHQRRQEDRVATDKENEDPNSSIDQLLKQAHEAVAKHTSPPQGPERPKKRLREEGLDMGKFQLPLVMEQDIFGSRRVPLDQLHGRKQAPPSNGEIERRKHVSAGRHPLPSKVESRLRMSGPAMYPQGGHGQALGVRERLTMPRNDEEEMLEYDPGIENPLFADNHVYASGRQAEDLLFRATSVSRSGIFEAQVERLEGDSSQRYLMRESLSTNTQSTHRLSIGREIPSEQLGGPQSEMGDEFAGFWKPNKLY